jgi:repressor LexA
MFIEDYITANNYPPTVREIAGHFGFSAKAAHDHIIALKKKAYIKAESNCSRAIQIIRSLRDEEPAFVEIPLAGEVSAGKRILSEANDNGTLYVHKSWLKSQNKQYFALVVRGDSMIGAGVMDGDTIIVLRQETAENGDIVIAEVDDGWTLKRYFKENSRVRLQPENPNYQPIYCRGIRIAGKLAGVYRNVESARG